MKKVFSLFFILVFSSCCRVDIHVADAIVIPYFEGSTNMTVSAGDEVYFPLSFYVVAVEDFEHLVSRGFGFDVPLSGTYVRLIEVGWLSYENVILVDESDDLVAEGNPAYDLTVTNSALQIRNLDDLLQTTEYFTNNGSVYGMYFIDSPSTGGVMPSGSDFRFEAPTNAGTYICHPTNSWNLSELSAEERELFDEFFDFVSSNSGTLTLLVE